MFPAALAMSLANTSLTQQFAILYQLGIPQVSTQAGELSSRACFFIWAHGLLARVPFMTDQARDKIMATVYADENIDTRILCDENVYDDAAYRLAIADKRFISAEFSPAVYLDIKTGETLSSLPSPPLEAIIYDLAELFRRNARHCKQVAAHGHNADEKVAGKLD